MNINKKAWSIASVCGYKHKIDTNPDYQRPAVWSKAQKQLLIDTILRGYDIPKFYWRKPDKSVTQYEVVDGQQRLRTIWEYQAGDFRLPDDADDIDGQKIKKLGYNDLPEDLRLAFDNYTLDVAIVEDADEDEVREMFLRLQNGTSLKAQEKRNAMPGAMRDYIKDLAKHPFFNSVNFSNKRFAYDHVAAQMTLLELEGEPTNIKNADLNRMYEENKEFNTKGYKAKRVKQVLDYLQAMFPQKTPELDRYSVISLYILISQLLEQYVVKERYAAIADWFIAFEKYRNEQHELPNDQCDREVTNYHEKISHSTDALDSLQSRHEYLMRKFFEAVPDIQIKDNQRLFTHGQRLAIFRRDGGVCQLKLKCKGEKCDWDNWEADHIQPWSKGGKTTVINGHVACPACNASKNNKNSIAA